MGRRHAKSGRVMTLKGKCGAQLHDCDEAECMDYICLRPVNHTGPHGDPEVATWTDKHPNATPAS